MKYIAFFIVMFLVLTSCTTNSRPKQTVLTAANLKSQFISLFADSAYNLKTAGGAIIKIPAGAFKVSGNMQVRLEIKEAYTLQDMVLAGLVTESNGKPLKSGGMIYINASAGGEPVGLQERIRISIPTEIYDNRMQLFKGEVEADSSINWVDPQPLDTGITAKKLAIGQALFKANCASCHKPTQDFTGPALAFCRNREPNKEWAYQFISNTNLLIETDPYARALKKKYASVMTAHPDLTKYEVKSILDYCDNEAMLNPVSFSPVATTEPCGYDTIYYPTPDTAISIIANDRNPVQLPVTENNSPQQNTTDVPENIDKAIPAPLDFTYKSSSETGMYDISINTFGWYNIDLFIEAYPNAANVVMKVQLQMAVEAEMNVFLFCPDKRLLTKPTATGANSFAFEKEKGTIPLFINDKAVILAFGSKGEKMYYGTASFNVKQEQIINIQVKETTETELKSFIQQNNIDGIKIDMNKKDDYKIEAKPCDGIYLTKDTTNIQF